MISQLSSLPQSQKTTFQPSQLRDKHTQAFQVPSTRLNPSVKFEGKGGMNLMELIITVGIIAGGIAAIRSFTGGPAAPAVAINAPSVNTRHIPLALNLQPSWGGKCVDGFVDGKAVEINVANKFLSGKTIKGSFQGQLIDLDVSYFLNSKTVKGTFKGAPVDLEVTKGFSGKYYKGTFQGKLVDLELKQGFLGRHLTGNFQGTQLDLHIDPEFAGKSLS
ncbi:MAG: hypothetical protein K2X66_15605, partial [Cyanobacteria bacterium]|nr:hypothetical protein [Cyanobacteriota bacterium]